MRVPARPALVGGPALAAALVAIGAFWLSRAPTNIDGANLEWSVAQFSASGALDSITVLNGKLFMAGADDDGPAIWISEDGLSWGRSSVAIRGRANQTAEFLSMGFVSGRGDQLIALGRRLVTAGTTTAWESALWTSDDGGKRWVDALATSLPQGPVDLVPTDDGYVALGQGPDGVPAIWTSRNGLDWRSVPGVSSFGATTVDSLAVRDGRLVAVGAGLSQGGSGEAMAWWSDDAATWERVGLTSRDAGAAFDVTATDSGFVAVGSVSSPDRAAVAWQSADGVSWQPAVLVGSKESGAVFVAASGDQFVAIGGGSFERGGRPTHPEWSVLSLTETPVSLELVGQVVGIVGYGDRYVGIGMAGCGRFGDCLPYLIWGLPPGANGNVRLGE